MSAKFAKTPSIAKPPFQALCHAVAGLALAGFAVSLSVTGCRAADLGEQTSQRLQVSPFGFGPMPVSLLDSARHEGPIPGVEPPTAVVQTTNGVAVVTGRAAPLAYTPL
jgi:hypothetical protein